MNNDEFINSIYIELKELGFVANQYDFSTMCGRTPTWFSAIKARRLPMTSDAFLTLIFNLNQKAALTIDAAKHRKVLILCEALVKEAQKQAGLKAARIAGCSFSN